MFWPKQTNIPRYFQRVGAICQLQMGMCMLQVDFSSVPSFFLSNVIPMLQFEILKVEEMIQSSAMKDYHFLYQPFLLPLCKIMGKDIFIRLLLFGFFSWRLKLYFFFNIWRARTSSSPGWIGFWFLKKFGFSTVFGVVLSYWSNRADGNGVNIPQRSRYQWPDAWFYKHLISKGITRLYLEGFFFLLNM